MQRRFWNWRDDDLTASINQWLQGLIDSGRYRGFDPVLGSTMQITLNHSTSGAIRVTKEGNFTSKYGVVSTKQGTIIQEYDNIQLDVDSTPVGQHRKDLIIVTHQYTEIVGGQQAIYSIIKGTQVSTDQQAALPLLTDEEHQTILGSIYLPENTTGLNNEGVVYTQQAQPNFANHVAFIEKENGFFLTELDARSNKIINLANPTEEQDAATKFYVDQAILNNIVWATEEARGIAMLASSENITDAIVENEAPDHTKMVTVRRWLQAYNLHIATQNEVNANVEAFKFVTPKTLGNRFATETRKGIARIATVVEAKAGLDDTTIITPYKLRKALPLIPVIVELGNWDINASATKTLAHTLGDKWDKVVATDILIVTDDQSTRQTPDVTEVSLGTTNVTIILGGQTGTFTSTTVNRGFVTFWIKEDLPDVPDILNVNAGLDINEFASFVQGTTQSPAYPLDGFVEAIGSPVASTSWTVVTKPTGSTVTIADATQLSTTAVFSHYGTYTLRLTATNDESDTAFDELTVVLTEQANLPPVINYMLAANYASLDPTFVHPDGDLAVGGWQKGGVSINATDPEGEALTYAIQEIVSIDPQTGALGAPRSDSHVIIELNNNLPHNFIVRGMKLGGHVQQTGEVVQDTGFYHFKVTVTDPHGASVSAGVSIKTKNHTGNVGNLFQLNITPNGVQPSSYNYQGFVLMNPIAEVHQLKATIVVSRLGSVVPNPLDAVLNIGGDYYGEGTYTLNAGAVLSSSPFNFQMSDQVGINSASVTFKAYDSSGTLIGQDTLTLTTP